jgi:hypothetical protein
MGGRAFGFESDRMTKDEYNFVCNNMMLFFNSNNIVAFVPPSYFSKNSFGDVDIVVENTGDMSGIIKRVESVFVPKYTHKNGTVFSFSFVVNSKLVQVDLIFAPTKHLLQSLRYLSYNDIWNLLGRLAHKQGFKLGHEGLMVPVKNGDYTLGDVLVTDDLHEMFDILDVDVKTYEAGFETPEDMYKFVVKSKWFTKKMFNLEELNHINRKRNAKRTIYMNFINWMKDNTVNDTDFVVDKVARVQEVLMKFPDANRGVQELYAKRDFLQAVSEKFNGHLVKEWTGLDGKELGDFMKYMKNKYTNEYFLECTDVQDLVMTEYKEFSKLN